MSAMRRLLLALSILVPTGLYVASGLYSVDADESAVSFALGHPFDADVKPGVHWGAPWPFGRVVIAKTRSNMTLSIGVDAPGDDGKTIDRAVSPDVWMTAGASIVNLSIDLQYTIDSLHDYILSQADPIALTHAAAERALNQFLLAHDVDDILTTGRQRLRQDVQAALQKTLDSEASGVRIQVINVQKLTPPTDGDVAKAFQDVQNASADRDKALQSAGAAKAQLLARARTESRQIRNDAEAIKNERIELARGETDRFLTVAEEYRRSPEIAWRRTYIDRISRILGRSSTFVIPGNRDGTELQLKR